MFDRVEAFHRPTNVREALRLLLESNGRARVVAGGTDIIVEADRSLRVLIDLTRAGLNYIRRRKQAWSVGATTTMAQLEESPEIRALAGGLLASAAAACGSIENRNLATIGGNLAHASPAGDLVAPLLALDAELLLLDAAGRRKLGLADYLGGRHRKSLLVEISIPDPPPAARSGWSFQKLGRTALDISIVNAAAGLGLDSGGRIAWARLAVGAAAPTAVRIASAEKLLAGRTVDRALLDEAAAEAARTVDPITDLRASAGYRREMSGVLARRALEQCAAHAGCSL